MGGSLRRCDAIFNEWVIISRDVEWLAKNVPVSGG
jgi:hypothetical protein